MAWTPFSYLGSKNKISVILKSFTDRGLIKNHPLYFSNNIQGCPIDDSF